MVRILSWRWICPFSTPISTFPCVSAKLTWEISWIIGNPIFYLLNLKKYPVAAHPSVLHLLAAGRNTAKPPYCRHVVWVWPRTIGKNCARTLCLFLSQRTTPSPTPIKPKHWNLMVGGHRFGFTGRQGAIHRDTKTHFKLHGRFTRQGGGVSGRDDAGPE